MSFIKISNNISELAKIAAFVEDFGNKNSLPMPLVFDINLSIDELVTNIILYGYKNNNTRFIDLTMDIVDNVIIIKIIDDAIEFDPTKKAEPKIDTSIDEKNIGGLGIYFVRKKMDEMNYKRENDQNILILKKILNKNK
ncbi:MAG: ATP-binding protein [bacterium]